jgi:GDPmannose 4,6-dehydratase
MNRRIADAAKAIETGKKYPLSIGDVSVEKEFGFAGDIAAGMFHLLSQDILFEACIGTGKAYSIKKWLELCFNLIGKDWRNYVEIDNKYVADFRRLVSDPSAINATGWEARTDIEELARLMLTSSSPK